MRSLRARCRSSRRSSCSASRRSSRSSRSTFAPGRARSRATTSASGRDPRTTTLWRSPAILPGDPARALLGLGDALCVPARAAALLVERGRRRCTLEGERPVGDAGRRPGRSSWRSRARARHGDGTIERGEPTRRDGRSRRRPTDSATLEAQILERVRVRLPQSRSRRIRRTGPRRSTSSSCSASSARARRASGRRARRIRLRRL